jgi:pyruvate dehydrogenase E2 component (dihydrolipoamide acetyltransferase)
MATQVIMPKQGLQMVEGTIMKWLISEGEKVELEQPLFEMETDKASVEIEASASGTLLKIIRGVGETVPVAETIAVIGEIGEDISAFLPQDKPIDSPKPLEAAKQIADTQTVMKTAKGERVFITPRAKKVAADKGMNYFDIEGTGPEGLIIEKDVLSFAAHTSAVPKVTPLAARIAAQNEVELCGLTGSGTGGKVMKADVEAALAARKNKADAGSRSGRVIPFTGVRKVISDRMMQSLHGMAQANHRIKVDMSEVIRLREKLKSGNIKVSFTDILVMVVSKALIDFPAVNASLTDKGILLKDYVNIGMAVAAPNGLIVPVIKDADLMSLSEISAVSAELIDKAKKGGLKPDDYTGGTFTITNLGMFDIDEFTAIINPPESAILAVGKIDRVPVAEGDSIVIRPVMVLSLTYDHRIIDGAPAAQFLQRVKQILLNPYLLI